MIAYALIGALSCGGRFEREGEPGCCYYRCAAGTRAEFSAYFSSAEGCAELAAIRCEEADPGSPDVERSAWMLQSGLQNAADTLDQSCPQNRPDWY
jgi:hypothetical protein